MALVKALASGPVKGSAKAFVTALVKAQESARLLGLERGFESELAWVAVSE